MKQKTVTIDIVLFNFMLSLIFEYLLIQNVIFVKICAKEHQLTNDEELLNEFCEKTSINTTTKIKINDELTEIIHNYNFIIFIIPLITTFFVGSWSDVFSRKFPICLSIFCSIIVQLVIISSYKQKDFYIFKNVMYICAFISSIFGGAGTVISNCYAYICDISKNENLTYRLSILQAFSFCGSFIGYNLVALLVSNFSLSNQFQVGFSFLLLLHLSNLFIVIFCMKNENKKKINFINLIDKKHLITTVKIFYKKETKSINIKLILFILCAFSSLYCLAIQQISLFPYLERPPFSISFSAFAYFQSGTFFLKSFSLIFIFPRINDYLKKYFTKKFLVLEENNENNDLKKLYEKIDIFICIISFTSKFFGLLSLGLLPSLDYLFLIPFLFMFNEFSMPALRSLIVKQVNENEKGKSLSLISFIQNFCFFTGSVIFKNLFLWSKNYYYGFAFELVAVLQVFSIIILTFLFKSYTIKSLPNN